MGLIVGVRGGVNIYKYEKASIYTCTCKYIHVRKGLYGLVYGYGLRNSVTFRHAKSSFLLLFFFGSR